MVIHMKILRLSLFNLRKNRREALAIVFLSLITVFLLGTAVTNILGMDNTYDECFRQTGSFMNSLEFDADVYRSLYRDILEEDFGIEETQKFDQLFGISVNVLYKSGEKVGYNIQIVTQESERKLEDFVMEDSLSDDEISELEHPVWLPMAVHLNGGFEPGDTFTMIIGGREYPFTVAGIYNAGLGNESGFGYRLVISDRDYELLRNIFSEQVCLAFDTEERFDTDAYIDECEARSSENLSSNLSAHTYWSEKGNETNFVTLFMSLSAVLAGVTMAASVLLIRHKISNDIEDQMQQIGVLEALGYRSNEISCSYIFEYVITTGIGSVLGIIAACAFSPVMDSFVGGLMGRVIHRFPEVIKIIAVAALVVAVTTLFALLKARHIKKFPPVVAFRKGIKTHSFRKNFFPLEKTGNSINVRLAFKSFFRNIMTNIGTGLCIVLAGTAMMFAVAGWDFFKDSDALLHCLGIEIADERIQPLDGVDAYELADELLAFPGVRKTMVTYNIEHVSVVGNRSETFAMVYEDFSETENIFVSEGRLPEHDNEVAISLKRHNTDGLNVGDSITLEGDGTRKSYVITGIVPAMGNNGMNIYMTDEAFLRCNPNARPNVVEVFLEEGVDRAEFERQITGVYGASAQDAAEADSQGCTLEDRIRSTADAQMATLISRYGVTDIDYAIVIGDQVITGRSSGFVIKEMNSFLELSKTQLEPIANMFKVFCGAGAIFVSIVVAAILAIIAASNIRRQRKDLGIMKSMGYTSKDLMKQLALSMLPTTVVSSAISIVIGSIVYKLFWVVGFGCVNNPNLPIMIITAILLVVFCYIVTYLAAGKIKQVSVTELMTE